MVSEIENIVKKSLNEEYKRQLKNIEDQCQYSSKQLNIVYKDIKSLIEELDINDATLLDFFMKTDGNVRVTKFKSEYDRKLELKTDYGKLLFDNNPIRLEDNTNYKIILIVVKEED